jgi:hypothetical protein
LGDSKRGWPLIHDVISPLRHSGVRKTSLPLCLSLPPVCLFSSPCSLFLVPFPFSLFPVPGPFPSPYPLRSPVSCTYLLGTISFCLLPSPVLCHLSLSHTLSLTSPYPLFHPLSPLLLSLPLIPLPLPDHRRTTQVHTVTYLACPNVPPHILLLARTRALSELALSGILLPPPPIVQGLKRVV